MDRLKYLLLTFTMHVYRHCKGTDPIIKGQFTAVPTAQSLQWIDVPLSIA
jgi:hypothetical protein